MVLVSVGITSSESMLVISVLARPEMVSVIVSMITLEKIPKAVLSITCVIRKFV